MYLVISDTHIGDRHSDKNLEKLYRLLDYYSEWSDEVQLILNGDIIDLVREPEFDSRHFIFFQILRKFKHIYYIVGNHDYLVQEIVERVPAIQTASGLKFRSGRQDIAVCHGHQFDKVVHKFPRIARALTIINHWVDDYTSLDLQRILHKSSYSQNKLIPTQVNHCIELVKNKVDSIVCGHTHHIQITHKDGVMYYNTGSWIDSVCSYLTIDNGSFCLAKV